VPTGVALRDVRQQLFTAAERILLRDGPGALTSRAVTAEAGVAKGVLHRYFADFDAFLVELVQDRAVTQQGVLLGREGTGTVAGNLADVLSVLFGSVALAMVNLITARDELRARLRAAGMSGVPLLGEAKALLADYLTGEQLAGRLSPTADVDTIALTLIGAGHLLFAGRDGLPPPRAEVDRLIAATLGG